MAKNKNLTELQAQADFMRVVLEEQQAKLENEPLVIEYDNGGGQKGIRENPEWLAYEKLLKSYHATLRAISAQQTEKAGEKSTGIGSPLKTFRGRHFEVVRNA